MAIARVVSFEGVTSDRVAQLQSEMQDREQPEGLNATELIVLHDPDADKSVVIVFFDNEDDYRQGDAILNAMPADETPGRRSSVSKYTVVHRMTT